MICVVYVYPEMKDSHLLRDYIQLIILKICHQLKLWHLFNPSNLFGLGLLILFRSSTEAELVSWNKKSVETVDTFDLSGLSLYNIISYYNIL